MPMISYQPEQSIIEAQAEPKREEGLDVLGAITQITPDDLEAGTGTPGNGRRGSRKELDDSVL
jgi:hypothetical protein